MIRNIGGCKVAGSSPVAPTLGLFVQVSRAEIFCFYAVFVEGF